MVENTTTEKYIGENLNKGYSPEAIKERLELSGYDPKIIRSGNSILINSF